MFFVVQQFLFFFLVCHRFVLYCRSHNRGSFCVLYGTDLFSLSGSPGISYFVDRALLFWTIRFVLLFFCVYLAFLFVLGYLSTRITIRKVFFLGCFDFPRGPRNAVTMVLLPSRVISLVSIVVALLHSGFCVLFFFFFCFLRDLFLCYTYCSNDVFQFIYIGYVITQASIPYVL